MNKTSNASERGPQLLEVVVADDRASWRMLGFDNDPIRVGSVIVTPSEPTSGHARGIVSWTFARTDDPDHTEAASIDGIPTQWASESSALAPGAGAGPLDGVGLDHVVMLTPDVDRSVDALEAAGFPARRERSAPGRRRQVFFWAGNTIIELVGPAEPNAEGGPASLWGLALSTEDIDGLADTLGDRIGPVTDAVQPGRSIATLRTKECGVSVAIAVMTPHPKA